MPAVPVDYETAMYSRIRTILENDPAWQAEVDPQNRIWYDDAQGTQNPDRTVQVDADYPQSKMYITAGANKVFLEDGEQTFQTFADEGPYNWIERPTLTIRVELTSELLNIGEPDVLRALTSHALRKSGPRMGAQYCVGWRYAYRTELRPDHQMHRWFTAFEITVLLEINGASIQSQT